MERADFSFFPWKMPTLNSEAYVLWFATSLFCSPGSFILEIMMYALERLDLILRVLRNVCMDKIKQEGR